VPVERHHLRLFSVGFLVGGALTSPVASLAPANAAAKKSTAAKVATVGEPCSSGTAVDGTGVALRCYLTAAGKRWVSAGPVPTPVPADAVVPSTWNDIVPDVSGLNAEAPASALSGSYANRAAIEARMVEVVNAERANRGLTPVAVDPRLTRLARWWAEKSDDKEFAGRGTSHCPASSCGVRANELGYLSFGEVFRPSTPFPAGDVADERYFVDSSRHLAILTKADVTHIGFGVHVIADGEGRAARVIVVGQVGRSSR
jgi:uncharacterized protein YkwD